MLTERQEMILRLIVDGYVKTAEPVGSKSLAGQLKVSSATIRNEMSILEELGFLEKTHTSSGRIPSEKGYRYYIETIIKNLDDETNGFFEFEKLFENKEIQRDELIKEAINLLSQATNCTAISLGPNAYHSKVKKVQMVPLNDTQALIIVITNFGYVESKQITIQEEMDMVELAKVIELLNELLMDTPISKVSEKLHYEIQHSHIKELMKYRETIVDSFIEAFSKFAQTRYYLTGQSNMLYQPEFNDIRKLREFIHTIENNEIFKIIETNADGISVKIGTENKVTAMHDCTVVSSSYDTGSGEKGSISIVGPTRMDYRKVIPLIKYIADHISKLYEEE
ncbi:MAG: heat-inducible transcriptional repressor HrcA [Candidatus Izemoplasmatales bacterium]|jgi:heat-inducible transcriptional repressor|nr:heat-inducible transcriptional repressor HrcA [Candidatus Izemoplasmatales bacterium]NLF49292.1 heat-inducible transcription repressor HrcA [Acholeplasmataceae bacterium]MDD4354827.1 heat-inducible transcriptional repressor HrcA [Candidatus Izemoplasmatales bacterium]MDD4987994.1 heat-inducible transcriptional repressor HrcA [Candidatus Izemoplasmatales bacterium]MDD5601953.1 heat-inducible transcriptional repressor HrcA [Candidatus Izemoplasmatales bacterium]